jgi:hypothetical protein
MMPTTGTVITESKEEKPEPTTEEKFAVERTRLNEEAAKHRREAKEAKKALEQLTGRLKSIEETLGVDEEHDLDSKIGEFRAAAEKGSKTGGEVVQLQQKLSVLDKDYKKLKSDHELTVKEKGELSQLFSSTTISHELRKSLAGYDLKAEQQELLENYLQSKGFLKLNDKRKPVWVVRDEDGDEMSEIAIKEGLASFFDKNPGYLPAQTAQGADTKESGKSTTQRVSKDAAAMFGVRNEDGIRIVDKTKYAEDRKKFIR